MASCYRSARHFYFLDCGNGLVIDGTKRGTPARYINHSCTPNCHVEVWDVEGHVRVGIFTSEDIPKGTELTYNYNFESFDERQQQFCFCGSAECCGMLGQRKEATEYRVSFRILKI
jgi:SET domain-containing protein